MKKHLCRTLLPLLILALGFGRSEATEVFLPYDVQLVEAPSPAKAGETVEFTLEVRSAPATVLEGVEVTPRRGWSQLEIDRPVAKSDPNVETLRVSAVVGDPDQALVLGIRVDGIEYREELFVPQPMPRQSLEEVAPRALKTEDVPAAMAASMWKPGPRPPHEPQFEVIENAKDGASLNKARTIRVRGRLLLRRPDGVIMGADGIKVKVHDEDGFFDSTQVEDTTDVNGYYDMSFTWGGDLFDPEPDLAVEFEIANAIGQVRTPNLVSGNYAWRVGTLSDFTGTEWNVGTRFAPDNTWNGPLYLLTCLTRGYRWFLDEGYDTPWVTARWPNDSSFRSGFNGDLYISTMAAFNEGTILHEYTHHFVHAFGISDSPSYCNGLCDSNGDCGHCVWCPETEGVAWSEGIAEFLGRIVPDSFTPDYGQSLVIPGVDRYPFETIRACNDSVGVGAPLMTEGLLGAFMFDLVDADDDNDPAFDDQVSDTLNLPPGDLLTVATVDDPRTASQFVQFFKSRFLSGSPTQSEKEALWATAMNNGFDLDVSLPPLPSTMGVSTHTIGVSSPRNVPVIWWSRPNDDMAGVEGYALLISTTGPMSPLNFVDVGDENSWYPDAPLPPGSYWFNLKVKDRSGKWSSSYKWVGPVVIADPVPADFAPSQGEFWAAPVLPRPTADASSSTVFEPTTLVGWQTSTYLNFHFTNFGGSTVSTPDDLYALRLIDSDGLGGGFGHPMGNSSFIQPGQSFAGVNVGPLNVRGGRHAFGAMADGFRDLAESNENNNGWAKQWIWSPKVLTGASPTYVSSLRPPWRDGGWDTISATSGGTLWYNCDGFRFNTEGWWTAVVLVPEGEEDNIDLRLHVPSTGPTNGFGSNVGASLRGPGLVDALLVNRNVAGSGDWDVGVIRGDRVVRDGYTVNLITSTLIPYDSNLSATIDADNPAILREVYVGDENLGPFSVEVTIDPTLGPITLRWYPAGYERGSFTSSASTAVSDETGTARIDVDITTAGYYAFMVVSENRDLGAAKSAGTAKAATLQVVTRRQPAELSAWTGRAGWAAPLVPLPTPSGSSSSVPLPVTLQGDEYSTYLNLAVKNDGPDGVLVPSTRFFSDGVDFFGLLNPNATAGGGFTFNSPVDHYFTGGRHTLTVVVDNTNGVVEEDETNNSFGSQWVFEPKVLNLDSPKSRLAPPDPFGGHDQIPVQWISSGGENEDGSDTALPSPLLHPNCDGLRTPVFAASGQNGYWGAMAILPSDTLNADLQVFTKSKGPLDGFADALDGSFGGTAQIDFVLVNFRQTPFTDFDVGITRAGLGDGTYTAEFTNSTFMGNTPLGEWGEFTLAQKSILDVYEITLTDGVYVLHLDNRAGEANLGLSVYASWDAEGEPYLAKNEYFGDHGMSFLAPAGQEEHVTLQVDPQLPAHYAVVVWKVGAEDVHLDSTYALRLDGTATDVPDTPTVARASLESIFPNPFNPRTLIRFELAQPERTELVVFNLRGERVRTLRSGELAAGRHEVVFDGVDDRGRPLSSGTYLVKLVTPSVQDSRKVTLLK